MPTDIQKPSKDTLQAIERAVNHEIVSITVKELDDVLRYKEENNQLNGEIEKVKKRILLNHFPLLR